MKNKLENPHLIQRLKKPFKTEGTMEALANAFSFGGGLVNGGLSKDAMSLLKDIWRYDYMGSSEFEWGAVPKSLHEIGKYSVDNNLTSFEFEVTAKLSKWSFEYLKKRNKDAKKEVKATVYVVCHKEDVNQVKDFITQMSDNTDDSKRKFHLKESSNFVDSICGSEYHTDTVGWHDIDNHYLFFTDKEMFDKISVIFGLKEPVK